MGSISWTPAVQEALNTRVVNRFNQAAIAAMQRTSGLIDICGFRTSTEENLSVFVLGKNFRLRKRGRDSDEIVKRGVNLYESRAKVANYVDWLTISRNDAIYDKVEKIAAIAGTAGASAGEWPDRMVETLVPVALTLECHTGQNFFDTDHPVKPGSSTTFANVANLGALDFDTFDDAKKRLMKLPDEDGNSCGAQVTVLAVGPDYEELAYEIAKNPNPKSYAGGTNLRASRGIEVKVVPNWDTDVWMVCDTRVDDDMPFYFVESRPLTASPLFTGIDDPIVRERNELSWGVDGHLAVALGNPRRAFMVANPANATTIAAKYAAACDLNDFDFTLD